MNIAEKLVTIAENQQKVYEAGKQSVYDKLEDPSKLIEQTVTGSIIRVNDVSEIPHKCVISVDADTDVIVSGKNLWRLDDTVVATETSKSGYVEFDDTFLPKGVPITISADITKYADDTATNTRLSFYCYYTNGTTSKADSTPYDTTGVERDGIARRKSATLTIDPEKKVDRLVCSFLDYSSQNGRNAKAEKIQIEVGSPTTYEPSRGFVTHKVLAGLPMEIESICPTMCLNTSSPIIITFEYHKSHGASVEYDHFWDIYQQNGSRTDYTCAFTGAWKSEIFKPKYDIKPTGAYMMFRYNPILADWVELFDTLGVTLDFSNCTNLQYCFYGVCAYRLGVINLSKATSINSIFGSIPYLHTIDKVIVSESTSALEFGCPKLVNITFEGVIAKNIKFTGTNNLSHDSIMSVINVLKDIKGTGTTLTATFGETNLAKITDAEKAIATERGWTLV